MTYTANRKMIMFDRLGDIMIAALVMDSAVASSARWLARMPFGF